MAIANAYKIFALGMSSILLLFAFTYAATLATAQLGKIGLSTVHPAGAILIMTRMSTGCALATILLMCLSYHAGCSMLRQRAWLELQQLAAEVSLERFAPNFQNSTQWNEFTTKFGTRWILTMPVLEGRYFMGLHRLLVHCPAFLRSLFVLLFWIWPKYALRALWRRATTGKWAMPISHEDIFNQVTGCSNIMLVTTDASLQQPIATKLFFHCPADMPLATPWAAPARDLRITLDIATRRVVEARTPARNFQTPMWATTDSPAADGQRGTPGEYYDLTADLRCLSFLLTVTVASYTHPKLHLGAELSTFEIARKKVEALEPSSRFTMSLHEGLLYSPFSPLFESPLGVGWGHYDEIRGALTHPVPHCLDPALRVFPFYDFMWRAHEQVARLIKRHNLLINSAHFIQGTVLHSVDHFMMTKVFKAEQTPMSGKSTLRAHIHFSLWVDFWTPVETAWNPFETEYISGKVSSADNAAGTAFYKELHETLKEINPELASMVLTSTSF